MKSLSELEARMAEAQLGDVIALADGVYDGERCRLEARGTADQPIVIRAENMGKGGYKGAVAGGGRLYQFCGVSLCGEGECGDSGTGLSHKSLCDDGCSGGQVDTGEGGEPGG